jgi:hypothetical protein
MSPREFEDMKSAVRAATERIRTVPVGSVDELVARVFPELNLVMGSLRRRYFLCRSRSARAEDSIGKTVDFLRTDSEGRFLRVLEHSLFERDSATTKELLDGWIDCFVARKAYPSGMGLKLYRLILSLPTRLRPRVRGGRLLSVSACIALSQFARASDHEDVEFLYMVAGETKLGGTRAADEHPASGSQAPDEIHALVSHVLADISQENVVREVALPIDTARASFVMDSVLIENFDEFADTTTAFYAHLLRHTNRLRGHEETNGLQHETKALFERTFGGEGSYDIARAEAKNGERGGMRFILDTVTEQFKREKREEYVAYVVHQAVGGLDWDGKVAFMGELLRRLTPALPPDVSPSTPERYARHVDVVVRAYASSMDRVTAILKTM